MFRTKAVAYSLLILFPLVTLVYFLCMCGGSVEFFHALLSKAGVSMGCRALCSFVLKIGCSGALALAIGFVMKALLVPEATPYLANMVLPAGADENGNNDQPVYPDNSGEIPKNIRCPSPLATLTEL